MKEYVYDKFIGIMKKLPIQFQEEEIRLSKNNLPKLEETTFETNLIAVRKGMSNYNDYYRIEHLYFCANKEYYKILGLLIISCVIQNKEITLILKNKNSDIKQIIIGYDYKVWKKWKGLVEKPIYFEHWANAIHGKHPYSFSEVEEIFFPRIYLVPEEGKNCNTDEDWKNKNTIKISGTSETLIGIADMFLNIGNPQNNINEIVLESYVGFKGVFPGSAEVTFMLPKAFGWDYETNIPEKIE